MENSIQFINASNTIKNINGNMTNDELLFLYGLYKQATVGNINITRPNFLDMKGGAKWDSWNKNKDTSLYDSEVNYINFVNSMIKKYGLKK